MLFLWIVFIFYVVLLIVKWIPVRSDATWDVIPTFQEHVFGACQTDAECQSSETCLLRQCYPKYRGVSECNPHTGRWSLIQHNGKKYAKCMCKYPQLVTQAWDGANCDVGKACGPNGVLENVKLNPVVYGRCKCDNGYYQAGKELTCRKLLPHQQFNITCTDNEVTRKEAESIFSKEYLEGISKTIQCIRKPCSFNVFNGKLLTYTHFDPKYGCICDPNKGNFGIHFKNDSFLKTEGYDACANIFENEQDVQVKMYSYFYIKNEPISFIHFEKLNESAIVPQLRNHVTMDALQVSEHWRFSFAQHVFRNKKFWVHTRNCWFENLFHLERCNENILSENQMEDCHNITKHLLKGDGQHANTYKLLYKYPVCFYRVNDSIYHDRVILNPFFLSFKEQPLLTRSNGFKITPFLKDSWHVDLAESEFDSHAHSSVYPDLTDDTVKSLEAGTF